MDNILLFGSYIVLAAIVVFASNILGQCVDVVDKRTNIGGALIGGVVLAAITSLPEFITSLSSTIILNQPGLAFGNIFGSNLFNLLILAVFDIFFIKKMAFNKINKIRKTNRFVVITYILILIPFVCQMLINTKSYLGYQMPRELLEFLTSFEIFGISYVSFVIIFVYYLSLIAINEKITLVDEYILNAKKDEEAEEDEESKYDSYSNKKVYMTMIVASIVLVIASLLITQVTDKIAVVLNLNASIAGALFLGIATSLPELTSCYALFKLNNFEAAAGGIIGSNMFNFTIIAAVDLFARDNVVNLIINDSLVRDNAFILLVLGLINSIIIMLSLTRGKTFKSKIMYAIPSIFIALNYAFYLVVSLV